MTIIEGDWYIPTPAVDAESHYAFVERACTMSLGFVHGAHAVPLVIPDADDVFYWTRRWQEEEAETLAELGRGEGRVFPSAMEAIKGLFEVEDDDS